MTVAVADAVTVTVGGGGEGVCANTVAVAHAQVATSSARVPRHAERMHLLAAVRGELVEPQRPSSFDKLVLSGVEGLRTNGWERVAFIDVSFAS
jgi:hypothetical protein